jgi:flagellum-specific peptidoglycan hydrolase FlgJ
MKKPNKLIYILGGLFVALIIVSKKKIIQTVSNLTNKQFIDKIKPYAISIGNAIGVPYKFIIAQICLETGYGKSSLSSKYNNYGGIKEFGSGPKVSLLTTECKNGVCAKVYQPFAVYPTIQAGMEAQSKIYQNRYFKQHLNKTNDPIQYANLIQSGTIKYATDPNYVSKITKIINTIA